MCFSVGFLAGLWMGVYAKTRSGDIWLNRVTPAYNVVSFPDMKSVSSAIYLDASMVQTGLTYDQRVAIFKHLDEVLDKGRASHRRNRQARRIQNKRRHRR